MALPKFFKMLFLFPILLLVIIVLNSLIEPMEANTDPNRASMNCPNTPSFDAVAWNNLSKWSHLTYSTECYILNWDVILFVGLLTGAAIWGWFNK